MNQAIQCLVFGTERRMFQRFQRQSISAHRRASRPTDNFAAERIRDKRGITKPAGSANIRAMFS